MNKKNSNLILKLSEIMSEVNWVEKKGRNSFFQYDYAKESDVLNAVREKLAKAGIFVFTSVESMDFRDTGKRTRDGSPVNMVFVKTKHTFWDGDSGENAEVFGHGCGEDSGDKAIYKAITGAMKYFVSKNFLMSTGDDPEKDGEGEDKGQAESPKGQSESPSFTPVPDFKSAASSPSHYSGAAYDNPAKDYIKEIQSKSGPKKDGSTYTRYSIETRQNGFFTTFNPVFADLATEARNAGQEVLISYKANGRWKDIESIRMAGAASPALSEADTLPF